MIEIVLLAIIVAQTALIGWIDYNNRKERKNFINALKSQNAQELANLDLADKTKIKAESPPPSEFEGLNMEDLMETSEPTHEEYERIIARSNKPE